MARLRRLSGAQVARILQAFGFVMHAQAGSHVKLRRIGPFGEKETLTIPDHRELDTGTLAAIFRQASRYVAEAELRPHFYTD